MFKASVTWLLLEGKRLGKKGKGNAFTEEGIVKNMNQSGFRHLGGGNGPDGRWARRGLVTEVAGRGLEIKGQVLMGKLRQLEITSRNCTLGHQPNCIWALAVRFGLKSAFLGVQSVTHSPANEQYSRGANDHKEIPPVCWVSGCCQSTCSPQNWKCMKHSSIDDDRPPRGASPSSPCSPSSPLNYSHSIHLITLKSNKESYCNQEKMMISI